MKRILLTLLLVMAVATVANAQATRTWVSGVGDDANPCSRTAPCKTFAGAISKTANGGIISVLDPGGFGAVTITKSITIDGTGQIAGILSAGTNGVIINPTNADEVHLRNIEINGATSGFDGIRVLNGRAVYVEHTRIGNITGQGIETPNSVTAIKLFVINSEIKNTGAQGILMNSSGTGSVQLTMEHSHISLSGSNGIEVSGANSAVVTFDSVIAQNAASGIVVSPTSSTAFLESTVLSHNANGIFSGFGGGTPVVRISRCMIVGNTTNGIAGAGGTVVGFSNNTIVGNAGNNNVNSSVAEQ